MHEPPAGPQHAQRFARCVVQAVAQMQGTVRDQEVVVVVQQRQVLDGEFRILQDQQARLVKAQGPRQRCGSPDHDRRFVGGILRGETVLERGMAWRRRERPTWAGTR